MKWLLVTILLMTFSVSAKELAPFHLLLCPFSNFIFTLSMTIAPFILSPCIPLECASIFPGWRRELHNWAVEGCSTVRALIFL